MNNKITLLDICRALANDEFFFHYQPIVSLISGKTVSAEALLRWKRPDGTIVFPADFIPLSVEKGFITEITRIMFPKMLDDLKIIGEHGHKIKISFNLTEQDLQTDDLARWMSSTLTQKGIAPDQVYAEIVEDVLMPPVQKIRDTIFELDAQNIPLVLNDFSAGNTSVQYLSQLPLSMLKLSMGVVMKSPESKMDFRVLRHLVGMAHQLRLDVAAEGVENQEIHDLILSTGCTNAQGYYYSHPLPLAKFIEVINQQPTWVNYPFGLEYLAQIDHIDFRRDIIREAMSIYTQQNETSRQKALNRLPALDANECLLGAWYINIIKDTCSSAEFSQLQKTHREFHETAKEILTLAKAGTDWSALKKSIDRFSGQSSEIMQLLQKQAVTKLLEYYQ